MYEKTQKRNPHKLTIHQHVFPRKSIERFAGGGRTVQVFEVCRKRILNLSPKEGFFCAKRVWDQKTETVFVKTVETPFQKIVDRIVSGELLKIGFFEKQVIDSYFALWKARHEMRAERPADFKTAYADATTSSLDADSMESLEKIGIMFTGSDGVFSSRFVAGIHIQSYIMRFVDMARNRRWGIVRAAQGEFIAPDSFNGIPAIPVTPKIILLLDHDDGVASLEDVININMTAVASSYKYYFARHLAACPIVMDKGCEWRYTICSLYSPQ